MPMLPASIRILSLLGVFLLLSLAGQAQGRWELQLKLLDKESSFLADQELEWSTQFGDSLGVRAELQQIINQLQSKAFLAASVDEVNWQDSTVLAHIYVGNPYEWAVLKRGNVDLAFLEGIGYRERLYQAKPFQYTELLRLQESLLTYAENHGFPFASVGLDSIKVIDQQLTAQLRLEKGPLIVIEGVEQIGDVKISDYYLENYLGLKAGTLYSKDRIERVRNRLKELSFLRETRDATVTFRGKKATANLFLEKKRASRWDFLIGLLPQTNSLDPEKFTRPIITASVLADMHNQLGLGEKIFFQFQQLQPQRQQLEFNLLYPYLLDLPFGVDFQFEMYRRDSAFLDVSFDSGLQYLMEGGNYVKVFWKNTSSFLQIIDTSQIILSGQLPDVLDVRNSLFGLEYQYQKLDYRYNPRKGWATLLRAGAGIKRIKENSLILSIKDARLDPEALYDSLALQSFQYRVEGKVEGYLPVFKNSALRGALEGSMIFARNPVYRNEQYRLGGNRLLRGFDEESINATAFAILTLEYRLLIGTNSNFYVFGNYAYVEDVTVDVRSFDRPYGFGAGLTFETKVGLFGFSLALGSQKGNPIDFRNVKTHFGYVSFF